MGSGPNMAFDGRWRVNVLIERAGDSAEVPLEIETRITPRWVSIQRLPGQAPTYTVEMTNQGLTEFSPDPERAGPSKLYVSCFDFIGDPRTIVSMVVTAATVGPAHQLPVRALDRAAVRRRYRAPAGPKYRSPQSPARRGNTSASVGHNRSPALKFPLTSFSENGSDSAWNPLGLCRFSKSGVSLGILVLRTPSGTQM